ncbi:MAG TPA: tRNA (guanosine(46)-N7)-methyltransferase TrmB [Candidatus Competibacter sp.]|nr:tRNA (guanosine(46)-N7)-methyltransferase TrmB [Candidatus Competibacteraceae bacterium]HRC71326.1 tRNA (guanosine(46)-N7)-methyltransferase TrmB [Candidatus Competibacter sp.]
MILYNNPRIADHLPHRIKSFVRREGRITNAQRRAFHQLWERFGIEISLSPIEPAKLFGRHASLILEIGFGDGESLAATCATNPEMDFLGIEVYRPGVGHLLLRAAELELRNLKVICFDAVEILERHLPESCLDRVQIFFPDPWPKPRHHKRRLIQPAFASLLARKLKAAGVLHIATDCESYARAASKILVAIPELKNMAADSGYISAPPYRPPTKFEQRAKGSGHPVWEILFLKPI